MAAKVYMAMIFAVGLALAACAGSTEADLNETSNARGERAESHQRSGAESMKYEIGKADEEWKKELTREEYNVLREKGTERAWTGDLLKNREKGVYVCAACGKELFRSDTKFESGAGWPSFYDVKETGAVKIIEDRSHGMVRQEVLCARCGGHLGHVFEDGPQPTGLRYCINSVSLDFEKKDK